MVPPCINKYYILDLQPDNSLIRYRRVGQDHRVFVVSWRNPDDSLAKTTWDDYIEDGVIRAIETTQAIGGQKTISTLGFCVGGTLLATALAVLAARGQEACGERHVADHLPRLQPTPASWICSSTNNRSSLREMTLGSESPGGGSLLKGQELASTFSFLRPNELVWNYVVGNYLKGPEAAGFRPALLEQRRHQPARADVCLVPA